MSDSGRLASMLQRLAVLRCENTAGFFGSGNFDSWF